MASPAFAKYQEGVANALALRCAVTGPSLLYQKKIDKVGPGVIC